MKLLKKENHKTIDIFLQIVFAVQILRIVVLLLVIHDQILQKEKFHFTTYPRDIQYVVIRSFDPDQNRTVSMPFISGCIFALILFFAGCLLLLWKKENLRVWIGSCSKRSSENQRGPYCIDKLKISPYGKVPALERAAVFEIDPRNLEIDENEKLGAGEFGTVYKGFLSQRTPVWNRLKLPDSKFIDNKLTVAVKMLPEIYNDEAKSSFLEEIDLMKKLGYHERLVNIIACVTAGDPVCLIVEYFPLGDLLRYLRKKKAYMEYISQNGFVHRDLAARNVLVDEDHNVKVCDFGLCRELESDQLYYTSKGGKLPVKWMALESITEYKFTIASDVWSFGILLFELFTLGNVPYPGIDAKFMECYLRSGKRVAKPENCTEELYKLMQLAWKECPQDRPTFSQIKTMLLRMIEDLKGCDYNYLTVTSENDYCNVKYGSDSSKTAETDIDEFRDDEATNFGC